MFKKLLNSKIISQVRIHFGFSYREMSGMMILLPLTVAFVCFVPAFKRIWPKDNISTTARLQRLDSIELIVMDNAYKNKQSWQKRTSSAFIKAPSSFNPNKFSEKQWIELGLKPYLAKRIANYVQKGGKFRTKKDLLKIYGFPSEVFTIIQNAIELPDSLQFTQNYPAKTYKNTATHLDKDQAKLVSETIIELNAADTAQLNLIKGIGPTLAARIVKMRDKLGGFHAYSQLSEVYGLKPEVIEEIQKRSTLNTNALKKININTASYEELKAHSYIGGKNASVIIKYRKNNGNFKSPEDLLKTTVIDESLLQKLKPYLDF
ncbi:MAG: hypothetical protein EAZ57_10395 [Cytophagales bacterium]|nr:MAG: hypothetical protein EAZ67_06985 [Cytophagales bacterium]TAF59648.1 MAG: hypothetical protein EAZ57_10395 [Cytophagales bacterium]